jgi:hypothetical protein
MRSWHVVDTNCRFLTLRADPGAAVSLLAQLTSSGFPENYRANSIT